ncbi:molybdopterin molybdotransferase MoeA [Brachybacterium sp. UNK5269]|uniref:molybdopterin molybdotransferase MoeA n=1 Tax=Brachybacterium sp. UNK5269 TaxID=3408576 RepID=UPI003BB19047
MSAASLDPCRWRDLLQREISLPEAVTRVPVLEAEGAVLGGEVRSPEDVPAVPIAAMDGFAVRRGDLAVGTTVLPVSAEIAARPGEVGRLAAGTAARIMTGAPVPDGADAVIEVEATDADAFGAVTPTVTVMLEELPVADRHIRRPGEEVTRGELLALPGDRVGAGLVGLARTLGLGSLPVRRPVRVAVVVTGDELTDDATQTGTVRESNGAMLAAALRGDGAAPRVHRSGDGPPQLRGALERAAADADLVLTTGGIGQGAFDVVKLLLGGRGTGTSRFEHLALRPGGPQGFGHLPGGTPVVHLPGTPVGALVGYHLFVRPLLPGAAATPRRVLLGESGDPGARPRGGGPGTVHARPGRLRRDPDGNEVVDLLPGRRLAPYGRADALVLARVGEDPVDTQGRRPGTALVVAL